MRFVLIICLPLLISACSATPSINLLNSMNMNMELNKAARIPNTVAVSPDGKLVLSGGFDAVVRIWDISEGKLLQTLSGHEGWISKAQFSPDSKFVLSGGNDKAIRLWDVATGKEIRRLVVYDGLLAMLANVHSVGFSPDGNKLLSACLSDHSINVWDARGGNKLLGFRAQDPFGAKFSPDGSVIMAGGTSLPFAGRYARFWDATNGKELKQLKHGYGSVGNLLYNVDITPDGRYALTAATDGKIKLWDFASGDELRTINAHSGINGVYSARFSLDSRYILSSGGDQLVKLWDAQSGAELKRFAGHSASSLSNGVVADIAPDGAHVVSTGTDAAVRYWDVKTGKEIAMMIGFEDGEWLVISSTGYYNASEKGAQYLNVIFNGNNYTVDQFYDVFYRPDIVMAALKGEDTSSLITITMQDAVMHPPPIVEFTTSSSDFNKPGGTVCYQVKNTGGGIGEVRLFHNGKLLKSDGYYRDLAKTSSGIQQLQAMNSSAIYENMRSVSVRGKLESSTVTAQIKGDVIEECREIDAVPGENEVSVSAFNGTNSVQSRLKTITFTSRQRPEESHLYILAIGIDTYRDNSIALTYAAKDAADIGQRLVRQSASVYKPQNIHYEILTNSKANKVAIINMVEGLSRVIKPGDSFIFFVAGHGVLLQNQYYMLTSDFDRTLSNTSMISSNEIVEISKKIKSLSQLFIFDTCHAGGVDTIVSGLYDSRMSVLAKKMGLHIYAAASSLQQALDGYKGNGLFTYSLLEGLDNNRQADGNGDNAISLVELGGYAKRKTSDFSRKLGHEQIPFILNFGRDSLVYSIR